MKTISKKDIIKNFSKYAFSYEDHSAVQNECAKKLLVMVNDREAGRILEIGCGTGRFTQILRQRFQFAEITAVDISPEMINTVKKKEIEGDVKFFVSDGEELEKPNRYDLIVSNASFQWFNNLHGTIGRLKEMLSENGRLCFSMYGPETFRELNEVLVCHYGSTGSVSSSQFVSLLEIKRILSEQFRSFDVRENFVTREYPSLMDFLREIKNSGTRGEGLGGNNFLGKNSIIEMEKIYVKKFGKIKVTHQVCFCEANV